MSFLAGFFCGALFMFIALFIRGKIKYRRSKLYKARKAWNEHLKRCDKREE